MYKILKKEKLNNNIEKMIIEAPYVAKRCEPGQFVILRVNKEGERIPLTIADFNREKQSVTIIYQVVGYTTTMLSQKDAGQYIEDFVGPLGMPKKFNKIKKVLGIGGGVGVAPLYPQLKHLAKQGVQVDSIIGARSKEQIILHSELQELSQNHYIATNDGTSGVKGFVTDILKQLLISESYDEVIAIGPLAMMKAVVEITKPLNIKTSVSLNPIMIDGTGMCGGCRVTVNGETKFACVDGPDFDGFLVDFDECISRHSFYQEEEHVCKLQAKGLRENEQK
ncbi:sulfide/dihydroorotate dehydrogenase-like FAD/NAD-binding protein [Clostridium sp. 'deep sea']|uniref:sulfide/dihydroorotate dehydrogenase-like FAD/NAD-binding protein n=1 Tax=Clostridium sp. 'deep sea' TaxID=2779445 RepID=UPI0018966B77|nr:sulfide/dihydroorotate dehydrogenase-like FAD/NAD-binding protein [Clostridium sp. 'deep sea']QOR35528.1 sulfide/dihydroorotate dehydrogenase-like FAD/NAD-binding protein [Clostridium sp. 'deep sea']